MSVRIAPGPVSISMPPTNAQTWTVEVVLTAPVPLGSRTMSSLLLLEVILLSVIVIPFVLIFPVPVEIFPWNAAFAPVNINACVLPDAIVKSLTLFLITCPTVPAVPS